MRALVLSGGGSRGAWQAGVLSYMGEVVDLLWPGGFEFGSGTSVGAINISGVAMFKPGDFRDATEYISGMWRENIRNTKDVWSLRFPLGLPAMWNPSAGVNRQLRDLLDRVVDVGAIQRSGVDVRFTAVDMLTGDTQVYTGRDLVDHGVDPIMASASYPLAFPPVEIEGAWLSDGGLRDTAPVGAAIDAGADEIVVVACRDPYLTDRKERSDMKSIVGFGLRSISLMMHETIATDVKLAELYNQWGCLEQVLLDHGIDKDTTAKIVREMNADKKVVKLTVLYPSVPLGNALDFSGDLMDSRFERGRQDAEAALSKSLVGLGA